MSQQNRSFSIRQAAEKIFAGVMSAAIVAFVAAGTVAMCLPGVLTA